MSKKLEEFIQSHKASFDEHQPSDALWKRIEKKLDNKDLKHKNSIAFIKPWMKFAAAIILFAITTAIVYNFYGNKPDSGDLATTRQIITPQFDSSHSSTIKEPQLAAFDDLPDNSIDNPEKQPTTVKTPYTVKEEELYHYTRLIEIQQEQMKKLKKAEPNLYKAFSKDMEMLETAYSALKEQLKKGVNGEKLLEAMMGNLRMQTELLQKQLNILKEVQKKNNDEKNYKEL
ncbi:MAG: hypothetical protein ACK5NK_12150 [Niabella sp.]